MKLWGLTGGIASGKSTVHRMFVACGAHVVDADATYHSLVAPKDGAPSPLTRRIADAFADVVAADGSLNRQVLGPIVFADAQARARLEAITHPAVHRAVQQQLAQWAAQGVAQALYDVPLLFERAMQKQFSGIIVVWVPGATQVQRLKQRDGLSDAAVQLRLAAQLPLDAKRSQATWCIDNSGAPEQTRMQVQAVWGALQANISP